MALIDYDQALADDLVARFDLRKPNADALHATLFALSRQEVPSQIVLDLATGVGKTYILAALLEYAAAQGVKNLLVVLPGKTVRTKTIANFTPGAEGFIEGAEIPKFVITPDNFTAVGSAATDPETVKLFLMNVHHLVQEDEEGYVKPDSAKARQLRTVRPLETWGEAVLDYLTQADDLFMVLDESHSYSESAATWSTALERLKPAARVGLTATPVEGDDIVFSYGLGKAIKDKFVKTPVVAMRRNGYRDNEQTGRLKDAKQLLDKKAAQYRDFERANPDAAPVNPIMLVSCSDTAHADEVAAILRGPALFGSDDAVLVIHSKAMTNEVEQQLADVQRPESPVRAIVQVDMLNEGWNVHNVAVLVPLRALESGRLTEQMIGRGLRLPYGRYTGDQWVDSLDILSHESVNAALEKHGLGNHRFTTEPAPSPTPDGTGTQPAPQPASGASGQPAPAPAGQTPLPLDQHSSTGDESISDVVSKLGGAAREIDAVVEKPEPEPEPEPAVVQLLNAETFLFPKATFTTRQQRLRLVDLNDDWVKSVANQVGNDAMDTIDRAVLVIAEKGNVRLERTTQASVMADEISVKDAVSTVLHAITRHNSVKNGPEGEANMKAAGPLAQRFISTVGGTWTYRRAATAALAMKTALTTEADRVAKIVTEVPVVTPLALPKRASYELPIGESILSQGIVGDDGSNFAVQQYYEGWKLGRYSAAKFDAFGTEFRIARLLDLYDGIRWWMRLYLSDGAKIEYGSSRSYYPDFVAVDADGIHWIIEGKDDGGRTDETVKAKRDAAERVLRLMETDEKWQGTRWGYLIAYQAQVVEAQDWGHLRSMTNASVMNPPMD